MLGIIPRATGMLDKSWELLPQLCTGVRTSNGDVLGNFMTVVEVITSSVCLYVPIASEEELVFCKLMGGEALLVGP